MRETESLYRTGRKRGTANATHPQLPPHPHPSFGGEVKFPTEDMENDDEYVHVHKSLVWCKIVFLIKERKKENFFFFKEISFHSSHNLKCFSFDGESFY